MILGESFYDFENADKYAPTTVVKGHAIGGNRSFFRNILMAVCGKKLENRANFWKKVIFTNCVQRAMLDKDFRPSSGDFMQGACFIAKQMEILKPALVISFNNWTVAWNLKNQLNIKAELEVREKVGRIKPKAIISSNFKLLFYLL